MALEGKSRSHTARCAPFEGDSEAVTAPRMGSKGEGVRGSGQRKHEQRATSGKQCLVNAVYNLRALSGQAVGAETNRLLHSGQQVSAGAVICCCSHVVGSLRRLQSNWSAKRAQPTGLSLWRQWGRRVLPVPPPSPYPAW